MSGGPGQRTGQPDSVPAMAAPPRKRDNPLTRSVAGVLGLITLAVMGLACFGSLPWTLGEVRGAEGGGTARYKAVAPYESRLPPSWWDPMPWRSPEALPVRVDRENLVGAFAQRLEDAEPGSFAALAAGLGLEADELRAVRSGEAYRAMRAHAAWPDYFLGTDELGRSVLARLLLGGCISLFVGLSAAVISVLIGTLYGAAAGYAGGTLDSTLMRIVDVLYGLPYILLVVLLAVAGDAVVEELATKSQSRQDWVNATLSDLYDAGGRGDGGGLERSERAGFAERSVADFPPGALVGVLGPAVEEHVDGGSGGVSSDDPGAVAAFFEGHDTIGSAVRELATTAVPQPEDLDERVRNLLELGTLLIAIGGVSWLTLARVIRGQVLSLKNQPFVEACRAMGAPTSRIFTRHLMPNLLGPVIVYATLTVPTAILQESFLSFLGIGVSPPLPSWGNLAADGLKELNRHKSNWWLLLFPSLMLAVTLLALNFVGEGLREAFDPKRSR